MISFPCLQNQQRADHLNMKTNMATLRLLVGKQQLQATGL